MKINLNVSENTFLKYLLDMGYDYNIINYNKLISSIRKHIKNEIVESIETGLLSYKLEIIFGSLNSANLLIFEDIKYISNIEEDHLKEIIILNDFKKYFKEKEEFFSKDIEIKAYEYILLENIDGHFTRTNFEYFYKKGSKLSYSIKKYASLNRFGLSHKENEKIKEAVLEKMIDYYFKKLGLYTKSEKNKKIIYDEMFGDDFDFFNTEPIMLIPATGKATARTERFDDFLGMFDRWERNDLLENIKYITLDKILSDNKPISLDIDTWNKLVLNKDIYIEYQEDIDAYTGVNLQEILRITNIRKRIVKDIFISRLDF